MVIIEAVAKTQRPLAGRTVAIPETRELDRFRALLQEQGATVVSCPMVSIRDVADAGPVEAWLRLLASGDFQDIVFMTGEGVTRLMGFAERCGLDREVLAALSEARTITRGPKPARALRQLGLMPTLPAVEPTTDGILRTLADDLLVDRVIGVQLYGQDPNTKLVAFLEQKGATVCSVAPYVYLPASDDVDVADLIRSLAAGSIDAIAFTTRTQVDRLFEVAADRDLGPDLQNGLRRALVAAVGPLVVDSLRERGVTAQIAPTRSFFLRPLVERLTEVLSSRGHAALLPE